MNTQREIIYAKRNEILDSESIHEMILSMFKEYITGMVNGHMIETAKLSEK